MCSTVVPLSTRARIAVQAKEGKSDRFDAERIARVVLAETGTRCSLDAGTPALRSEAGQTELVTTTEPHQASFDLEGGLGRAAPRPTGAILESGRTSLEIAAPPLMSGLARDAHCLGRAGDRPALFDHLAEPQSVLRGQRSVTVHPVSATGEY